jgi:hypothetical protein
MSTAMNRRATTALALLLILAAAANLGCHSTASEDYEAVRNFTAKFPDGTEIAINNTTDAQASLAALKGTDGPSDLEVTENGAKATLAGWFPPIKLDVNDRTAWIYALAGIAGVFAAALLFGTKWRGSAIALGLVSGGVMAAPTILQKGGTALTIITLAAGGAAAAVAVWRTTRRCQKDQAREEADRREAGLAAFQKLMSEGKPDEAIAARRASDPEWDWKAEAARQDAKRARTTASINIRHALDSQPAPSPFTP